VKGGRFLNSEKTLRYWRIHVPAGTLKVNNDGKISMFHHAFFNSIIDKYQHMHFFTFNTILVQKVDFIKVHKNI